MKNQRTKNEARNFRFLSVAAVLMMLAMLICCFTVMTAAADTQLSIGREDLDLSGLKQDAATGLYYKVYDGKTDAAVALSATKAELGIAAGDDVTVKVNAAFNSKNVKDASYITVSFELTGADKDKYVAPASFTIDATIRPVTLEWAADGTASTTYEPGKTTYSNLAVTLPGLKAGGVVSGDTVSVSTSAVTATVGGVDKAGDYTANVAVALTGADKDNYTIGALNVKVTVGKILITEVKWDNEYSFVWGDAAANKIEVYGYDANDKAYKLVVVYPDNYGSVGEHTLKVALPDADNMDWAQNNTSFTEKKAVIAKKQFTVSMNDATYVDDSETQDVPTLFNIAVEGDIPADIRALISYTSAGNAFLGATGYGKYTVVATLPTSENYEFVTAAGTVVTSLSAELTINKKFIPAGTTDAPYQMILIGENGFAGDVTASVSIPEKIAKKAIRGFAVHTAYTLKVTGADAQTFTVLVPISDTLYHKNCSALTVNDIYVYEEATGSMVKANEKSGYTVTLGDGYYMIEGVSGSAEITFVIAPVYNTPFALTPTGIAIWIAIVLLVLVLLIVIGMYIRSVREPAGETILIIDTGDAAEVVPAEVADKVDEDAYLTETAENLADTLEDQVDAEAEAAEDVNADEAVAEVMDEVTDIEDTEEAPAEEAAEETDVAEDMADEKAEELEDSVDADSEAEAEADEDALRDAVAAAMEDNFNDSADATDAVVIVAEEEESDEITPEDFKAVVDAIVSDAMCRTMDLPEEMFAEEEAAEEATEEAVEETAEAATEEAAEEAVEETVEVATEEAAEEAVEETVEATTEEAVEETAEAATEEAVEETAEAATEEAAEEAVEETAETATEEIEVVVEEMSGEDICAIVADSVAEAFELVTVDGVVPKAVEGTTAETIEAAVKDAADENVPEIWTEAMAAAVIEAVTEELAARLLVEETPVEEPAVETFVEVDEDDNDNDDDNDDDDSFFGFGSMPLDFIDAVAEADRYAEMLEQEGRGEVRLVTRYRRSYTSRLIQSQGNVQDYYTILKNALLSHKGVKNRISWNYEAFNRGRTHVAKINAKTKTLYLYLALDPEELKDTKYGIVDVSSKKKYASVPVLMKIKGERKFKYALELIAKLCEEKLELPKLDVEEVDYRMPYQTTEELVESGVVKKLVASVPVSAYGAESTEEAPVEAASATAEAQEVSFVEPTTAPAVEAAAEEVAAEEAVADETPAQDTPADAGASEDEPKEV